MSRADGVLVAVLKRKPFEDIRDGIKLEEYRGSHWCHRLMTHEGVLKLARGLEKSHRKESFSLDSCDFHPYHTLRAFLGYAKNRPMIERPILHIDWGKPNPEWTYGIVSPGECFRIHLEPMK